jgi:hypothetical protein
MDIDGCVTRMRSALTGSKLADGGRPIDAEALATGSVAVLDNGSRGRGKE